VEVRGPLAGVRVLALEQSVAAPIGSRILADMGADVIKVEAPHGDFSRHWDSHVRGRSSHFVWLSRRKRSIVLSLREPGDRAIFDRLLRSADVLIFNLAAPTAASLGLTPEYFEQQHPSLVACQITGYGRNGRASHRRAYDMLLQAEAGLLDLTGDDQGPVRIGVSISDIGTGIYAASMILAALYQRANEGKGRFIDLSMFEVMTEFAGPNLTAFANAGVRYPRIRSRHHNIVPYGIYACSDGYVALAVEQDSEWQIFCRQALSRTDLAERADYARNEQRVLRRSEVDREVEAELARRTRAEWQECFEQLGLAYGVINEIDAVWQHPVAEDLELRATAVLADGSEVLVPRSPAERIFGVTSRGRVPDLDENRRQILEELSAEVPG